jgi:hypothetical protein
MSGTGRRSSKNPRQNPGFDDGFDVESSDKKKSKSREPQNQVVVERTMTTITKMVTFLTIEIYLSVKVGFLTTRCPSFLTNSPKPGCDFVLKWGSGFSNPKAHLSSCYGGDEELYQLYRIAQASSAAKASGLIHDFFPFNAATTKEKAVYDWFDFIVMESQPLSVVENARFGSFYKRNVDLSIKFIKDTLFALVELVKQKIAAENEDGWSWHNHA